MRIIIFEDDKKKSRIMEKALYDAEPLAEITAFAKTTDVLAYVERYQPEVAFISLENPDGRGYFLIKKMKNISPRTNVIVVASRYRFLKEIMGLRVSGYVIGELTKEIVADEIAHLRYSYIR